MTQLVIKKLSVEETKAQFHDRRSFMNDKESFGYQVYGALSGLKVGEAVSVQGPTEELVKYQGVRWRAEKDYNAKYQGSIIKRSDGTAILLLKRKS